MNQEQLSQDLPNTAFELHPTAPELNERQSQFLNAQWETFLKVRNEAHIPSLGIVSGDLVHNMSNPDNLESVLQTGIISGEIGYQSKVSIPEDSETHYCADFFVVPDSVVSVGGYLRYTQERIQDGRLKRSRPENYCVPLELTNNVMIIFEGNADNNLYQSLLRNSATSEDVGHTNLKEFPIRFPLQTPNHRAVLVGLPANYAKGVVLGGRVTEDVITKIKVIRDELGLKFEIYNYLGEVIH